MKEKCHWSHIIYFGEEKLSQMYFVSTDKHYFINAKLK